MDDDLIGDEEDIEPPAAAAAEARHGLRGPWCLVICIACANGFWLQESQRWAATEWPDKTAVGCAVVRWVLSSPAQPHESEAHKILHKWSLNRCRIHEYHGYISYEVVASARFLHPTVMNEGMLHEQGISDQLATEYHKPTGVFAGNEDAEAFGDILSRWRHMYGAITKICMANFAAKYLAVAIAGWVCIHAVAICAKINKKNLIGNMPNTRSVIRRFKRQNAPQLLPRRGPSRPTSTRARIGVELILEWVTATKYLKDLKRHAHATCMSFGKIYERSFDVRLPFGEVAKVAPEQLRAARVRIDSMALQAWRAFFQTLNTISLCLFVDASPQWRGTDMHAASFEITIGSLFYRRLFTPIALETGQRGLADKMVALVWQIFLLVGPSYNMVRKFLNSVVCILTDAGTERELADGPDIARPVFILACAYSKGCATTGVFVRECNADYRMDAHFRFDNQDTIVCMSLLSIMVGLVEKLKYISSLSCAYASCMSHIGNKGQNWPGIGVEKT